MVKAAIWLFTRSISEMPWSVHVERFFVVVDLSALCLTDSQWRTRTEKFSRKATDDL